MQLWTEAEDRSRSAGRGLAGLVGGLGGFESGSAETVGGDVILTCYTATLCFAVVSFLGLFRGKESQRETVVFGLVSKMLKGTHLKGTHSLLPFVFFVAEKSSILRQPHVLEFNCG